MSDKNTYSTNVFFTSDTHFRHNNILEYFPRPGKTILEMEDILVDSWNKKVSTDTHIFHLGDFAFTSNISTITSMIKRLNGHIHLIMGNHDYQNKFDRPSIKELFASVNDYLYIHVKDPELQEKQGLFLCHYPMWSWNQSQKGSWQLHGHIHSSPTSVEEEDKLPLHKNQYDVGVDNNNFAPVSYEEIKIKITKRYF